jgi:hypothetical protein
MSEPVDRSELEFVTVPGIRIHEGGNARLYFCRYAGEPYLFKDFRPEHRAEVDGPALFRLVDWRTALPPAERGELDRFAAWPRHVVGSGDLIEGVLIPFAEERFLAVAGPALLGPRGLTELDGAEEPGLPAPPATVVVLGRLITAVRRLHRHGILINDLQPENVLCAPAGPDLGVYLVDCDSMISGRHWGRVAAPTAPDLMNEVQPTQAIPTPRTDLVKLKWTIVRVLLEVPNQVGLGTDDRAALAAAVPAGTGELLLHLLLADGDTAAWDQLAARWSNVRLPLIPPSRPPSRRGSWLPPDFAYRPAPGPQVLPARLLPSRFGLVRPDKPAKPSKRRRLR